jgi:hypothetical protein
VGNGPCLGAGEMKEPLHRWREERKEKKKREEIKKYII